VARTISRAHDEGARCLSANAPNGTAAMFRTALAYLVEHKGSVLESVDRTVWGPPRSKDLYAWRIDVDHNVHPRRRLVPESAATERESGLAYHLSPTPL